MFCKYCGKEIENTARFCCYCGKSLNDKATLKENIGTTGETDTIRYELKPKFVFLYKFMGSFLPMFVALFFIYYYCVLELEIAHSNNAKTNLIIILCLLLLAVIISLIKMYINKKQYNRIQYNFYNKKLEYVDGFLNIEEKTLKYSSIREITMHQDIFEKLFNIGTIHVYTTASSGNNNPEQGHNNSGGNGIHIHCIENVNEQYKKIKQIIDEATE